MITPANKCTSPFCDKRAYSKKLCINCYRKHQRKERGIASKTVSKQQMDNLVKFTLLSAYPYDYSEYDLRGQAEAENRLRDLFRYAKENNIPMTEYMLTAARNQGLLESEL